MASYMILKYEILNHCKGSGLVFLDAGSLGLIKCSCNVQFD